MTHVLSSLGILYESISNQTKCREIERFITVETVEIVETATVVTVETVETVAVVAVETVELDVGWDGLDGRVILCHCDC